MMSRIEAVARAIHEDVSGEEFWPPMAYDDIEDDTFPGIAKHVLEALDALRVTTLEELNDLPVGTVVRDGSGEVAIRTSELRCIVLGEEDLSQWVELKLPVQVLRDPRDA